MSLGGGGGGALGSGGWVGKGFSLNGLLIIGGVSCEPKLAFTFPFVDGRFGRYLFGSCSEIVLV